MGTPTATDSTSSCFCATFPHRSALVSTTTGCAPLSQATAR